jgi:hypothetical protein
MAQIVVHATKEGTRIGEDGLGAPCWILHYVVRIPAGTEGIGPNGRYDVTVIEVPGPKWYH